MSDYFFSKVGPQQLTLEGVAKVEQKYNAKFMGPFCIKDSRGNWTEIAVDVFYQPNPDTSKGHSEYFGIYTHPIHPIDEAVYICNAISAFSEPLTGIVANSGEVVVSRWRHDYRSSYDQSVSIDGGRDYVKITGNVIAKLVKVGCKNGELYVMENNK